jgi:hypothetical protein
VVSFGEGHGGWISFGSFAFGASQSLDRSI